MFKGVSGIEASGDFDLEPDRTRAPGQKLSPLEQKMLFATQPAKEQIAKDVLVQADKAWKSDKSGHEIVAELAELKKDIETLKKYKLIPDEKLTDNQKTTVALFSKQFKIFKGDKPHFEMDARILQAIKQDIPFFKTLFESDVGKGKFIENNIKNLEPGTVEALKILNKVYMEGSNYVCTKEELNHLLEFANNEGVPEILLVLSRHVNLDNAPLLFKYALDTDNVELYKDLKDNMHLMSEHSGNDFIKTKKFVLECIKKLNDKDAVKNFPEISKIQDFKDIKSWGSSELYRTARDLFGNPEAINGQAKNTYLKFRQAYFDLTKIDINSKGGPLALKNSLKNF